MKKVLAFLILLACACLSGQAAIVFSDNFNYGNGTLLTSSGNWTAHSGGGSNPILVTNGQIAVRLISGTAEDDHADLPGAPFLSSDGSIALYSSFTIILSNTLPSTVGTYFAHFRGTNTGAATDFGARVFVLRTNTVNFAPVPDGKFRLSIGNGAASTNVTYLGQIDQDLDTNVVYTVVTRFVPSTGLATIWLNPNSESDPSATATDPGNANAANPFNVFSYSFRQADGGSVTVYVDDLKIGTQFNDVAGANTSPTISGIADQTIAADSSTGPVPFTVDDNETAAGSLIVSATSSNTTLVPNGSPNLVLGGSGGDRTITVTPAAGQQGSATIAVTVSDGVNSSFTTFEVKVGYPVISQIPGQITRVDTATAAIPFTIGDAESAAGTLILSADSSNPTLVAPADLSFGGSDSNRTVTVTPEAGQTGFAVLTIYVSDGARTNSTSFSLTVSPTLGVLFSDNFSYTSFSVSSNGIYLADGSPWVHSSPTGTNFYEVQVITNLGVVELDRSLNEDVSAPLANGPYAPSSGAVVYAGFIVNFTALPSNAGNYFLHYRNSDVGTFFHAKVFASTTNAGAGFFRLGIANSANSITAASQFPRDLSLNQPYVVVTRLNVATAESWLWVNPTSEASPNVAAADFTSFVDPIAYISLRQDSGIGTNQIDNLVVSGSFADVLPSIAQLPLTAKLIGGELILSWTNPLFTLQSAPVATGPYTDISGATSPYTNSISGDQQFFRLKY